MTADKVAVPAKSRKADAAQKATPAAAPQAPRRREPIPAPRLKVFYMTELRPRLQQQLQLKNINQVPRLIKIVINSGLGEGIKEYKVIEAMSQDLSLITGQKPILRRAYKDVSAFGVRAGNPVGLKVTLRSKRMYEFLDRFINITLPRIRDFHGISPKNFDHRGNLTIGVQEQTMFPEIDIDKVFRAKGMNVTFVTTAESDDHALALFEGFGLPFMGRK